MRRTRRRLRLTAADEQHLARRAASNQAYELLLKGRFYENKGGKENRKKATEYYRQAIAADPDYAPAYAALSLTYNHLVGDGILDPKEFVPRAGADERAKARAILKHLETSKEYVAPGELAVLYAALGEREQAFASLEKAYAEHDQQLQYLGVDPALDTLRLDPRFADLIRRVGLPQ